MHREEEKAESLPGPEAVPSFLDRGGSVLSFEVAGQCYGLPVGNVVQIVEMVNITRLPKAPEIVQGVADYRGKVIPIIDMRRRIQQPAKPYTLRTPIVIGHLNGRTVGLVVDHVSGVVDLLPEQIEAPAQIVTEEMVARVHHLTGVARLDDGLLLLVDPATFLSPEEEKGLAKALPRRRGRRPKTKQAG